MCLSHDRSYHTWVLLGLQGFRHLFKRTCWAIWLLWVTGSGTWRPRQLLRKGEKIKSTLCHLFISLLKCRTASKQSLCCSLCTSLSHLSFLICILILINISKRLVLQLWQVCPGSIVGCLVQLLLHFPVEEPPPLWAEVCLEQSLQFRSLHRPQEDHGVCTTHSREAIKPPQGFEGPLPHVTPSSFQLLRLQVFRLILSRAVQALLTSPVVAPRLWGVGRDLAILSCATPGILLAHVGSQEGPVVYRLPTCLPYMLDLLHRPHSSLPVWPAETAVWHTSSRLDWEIFRIYFLGW